jgi:alkenylglycerophosphocholine hydrolase
MRKRGNEEMGRHSRNGSSPHFPISPFPSLLLLLAAGTGWAYLAGVGGTWSVALKAAPVLCLAAIVRRRSPLVCLGLVASGTGDACLDLGQFLPGVAAFMLAHVFYVGAFLKADNRFRPWHAAPFVAWGAIAFTAILPALAEMLVPVAVYLAVICVMMWRSAAQAWPAPIRRMAWLGCLGAVMFGASDTLIALARWRPGFSASGLVIMGLYWGGQVLIAAWGRQEFSPPSAPGPSPLR